MRTGIVVSIAVLGSIAYAEPPKPADVQWAWASVKCKDGVCKVGDQKAAIAWAWPKASPKETAPTDCHCGPDCGCGKGCDCKCTQGECYDKLRARAIKEQRPLIVGVGCEPPHIDGVLACRHDKLAGFKEAVVVSKPTGKELFVVATLPCKVSADTITATLKPKAEPLSINR